MVFSQGISATDDLLFFCEVREPTEVRIVRRKGGYRLEVRRTSAVVPQAAEGRAVDEITIAEACKILGRRRQTVLAAIDRHRLNARKVGPIYLVERASVEEYAKHRSKSEK